jgi:hypothetical protein
MEYAAYLREIDRAAEATDGKVVSLAGGRQSCQPVTSQKPGVTVQLVAGIQTVPLVSSVRTSKGRRPCLAAVER